MRTTVTIPDEYYNRIKLMIKEAGYTSVNNLILSLIRDRFALSIKEAEEKKQVAESYQDDEMADRKVEHSIDNTSKNNT